MTAPRVEFTWQISLGHLLTMTTMLAIGVAGYTRLEASVEQHDRNLVALEQQAAGSVARIAASELRQAEQARDLANLGLLMAEVRDELKTLNREGSRP